MGMNAPNIKATLRVNINPNHPYNRPNEVEVSFFTADGQIITAVVHVSDIESGLCA